ncbi:hypothetical protein DV515_00002708 [Chloebia gouldiae]|uniref:Uncharacterized protein n=1 Tax=Chloebia gouldiae TaxID=44316 RepID=A0A3L8SUD1_CHLGU|nr:hypothetical protein DV515_00002708 [Chloebia gouldiae]
MLKDIIHVHRIYASDITKSQQVLEVGDEGYVRGHGEILDVVLSDHVALFCTCCPAESTGTRSLLAGDVPLLSAQTNETRAQPHSNDSSTRITHCLNESEQSRLEQCEQGGWHPTHCTRLSSACSSQPMFVVQIYGGIEWKSTTGLGYKFCLVYETPCIQRFLCRIYGHQLENAELKVQVAIVAAEDQSYSKYAMVHMFRVKTKGEYLLGLQRTQAVNYSKGSQFAYKNSSEGGILFTFGKHISDLQVFSLIKFSKDLSPMLPHSSISQHRYNEYITSIAIHKGTILSVHPQIDALCYKMSKLSIFRSDLGTQDPWEVTAAQLERQLLISSADTIYLQYGKGKLQLCLTRKCYKFNINKACFMLVSNTKDQVKTAKRTKSVRVLSCSCSLFVGVVTKGNTGSPCRSASTPACCGQTQAVSLGNRDCTGQMGAPFVPDIVSSVCTTLHSACRTLGFNRVATSATSNDRSHAENLKPWRGSSTRLAKDSNAAQRCTTVLLSETRLQLPTFKKD